MSLLEVFGAQSFCKTSLNWFSFIFRNYLGLELHPVNNASFLSHPNILGEGEVFSLFPEAEANLFKMETRFAQDFHLACYVFC